MIIGYARVSTPDQVLDLQVDALEKAGCEKIYVDEGPGTIVDRQGLNLLKQTLRRGDTLVVWRLDRLGRSLRNLVEWLNFFQTEGVGFRSLTESIDTTTASGRLIFHLFASMAEFEHNLIKERVKAGMAAARARGRKGGRPKKLNAEKRKMVVQLYNEQKLSVPQICDMMGISKPTLYEYVKAKE